MHTAFVYEYTTLLLYFQVHTYNFGIIYMYHVYLCTVCMCMIVCMYVCMHYVCMYVCR